LGQGEKTQQAIQLVLKNFLKSRQAPHVQDVTAHDVAAYWQFEVDNSPAKSYRTAHNRGRVAPPASAIGTRRRTRRAGQD
jgi:hypothetical protein